MSKTVAGKDLDFGGAIESAVHQKEEDNAMTYQLYYPMWVMPLLTVLGLRELLPHLQIKEQLVKFSADAMVAAFVSHQWVGIAHPDPDMRQFRVLQSALRGILKGDIKVEGNAAHQLLFKSRNQMTDQQVEELRVAHVWYDWFSCPQINARSPGKEAGHDLQAAVDSIPAYVHLSNFFIILAPTVAHCQSQATECDYNTWRTRGWCRLELFAWVAAEGKPPTMLVQSVNSVHFLNALQWHYDLPGTGVFTVESDRARIRSPMEKMLNWKLRNLSSKQDLHDWRFFLSMRGRIMRGLADPPRYDRMDDFLSTFGFRHALDVQQAGTGEGWSPLHYAAITGGGVVAQLVACRCDPNGRTRHDYPRAVVMAGCSPLYLAACLGPFTAVLTLLRLRADPLAADDEGYPSLTALLRNRDIDVSMLLDIIDARADINQAGHWPLSYTPLHMAASLSSPEIISALVDMKADLSSIGAFGDALMTSSFWNGAEAVEVLLEKRMDPNASWDTRWTGRWALCMTARAACSMGAASMALESLALMDGATPLMYATLAGNTHTVRVLLAARADPMASNTGGRTPASMAVDHGHAEIMALLQEASSRTVAASAAGNPATRLLWGGSCTLCACPGRGGFAAHRVRAEPAIGPGPAARCQAEWDEFPAKVGGAARLKLSM